MKRLCLILALSVAGTSLHAGNNSFLITSLSKIMLNSIDTDSAFFTVYSPGKSSGICGLIMVSTSGHEEFHDLGLLLSRFEISTAIPSKDPVISKNFARFSLLNENSSRLYINVLKIKTKDGKSISQNIKDLYKYPAPVGVTAAFCRS